MSFESNKAKGFIQVEDENKPQQKDYINNNGPRQTKRGNPFQNPDQPSPAQIMLGRLIKISATQIQPP